MDPAQVHIGDVLENGQSSAFVPAKDTQTRLLMHIDHYMIIQFNGDSYYGSWILFSDALLSDGALSVSYLSAGSSCVGRPDVLA